MSKLCAECKKGPGFRLDLIHIKDNLYKCPMCGSTWQLTTGEERKPC